MANKAISELPQAQNVNNQDLFVLEQSGIAKKLTAETFITEQGIIDALAEALDGHGGIQSVTLASVSGRIRTYRITFSDGSATTFQVYDGTSIDRIVKTSTAGLTDTYTVFMNDGSTTFFTVTNGADGSVSEAMLNDALKDKAPVITETTESSAIANFTDGADDMVMHNVVAEINPVQDLSNGDPSPTNICPITGHTQATVTRTGKNIADKNIFDINKPSWSTAQYWIGLSENADGTYTLTRPIGWGGHGFVYIGTYPAGTYTVSFDLKSTASVTCGAILRAYNTKTWVINAQTDKSGMSTTGRKSMSTITTTAICDFWLAVGPYSNNGAQVISGDYQVELGNTATAYEPYQGNTVTVDWTTEAGTVYGGTIDVATGLLTVTHGILDLGTKNYTKGNRNTDNTGYIFYFRDVTNIAFKGDAVCSALKTVKNPVNWEALPVNSCNAAGGSYMIFCADYADAASFKTAMDGVQLVYTMATSQTYQLSGQQLATLLGTNNVWADTGNVSVTYPADTKMFIEKLTQPTEDDMVANQAITSGKFFMVGNNLYIATAAIASGAKIIEGTNATRLSLADALNRL